MPVLINTETILYNQPLPVSLPYTLPRLPTPADLEARKETLLKHKKDLEDIEQKKQSNPSTDAVDHYSEWHLQIQRMNPGFSSASSVMMPTTKLPNK